MEMVRVTSSLNNTPLGLTTYRSVCPTLFAGMHNGAEQRLEPCARLFAAILCNGEVRWDRVQDPALCITRDHADAIRQNREP